MAVPDELEDEDMMEMLNVGLLDYIVVDDWKARMWAQVLPKITLNEGAVVREGGLVGWALRKDSPKLAAELNDFYTNHLKKLGVANYLRAAAFEAHQGAEGFRRRRRRQALPARCWCCSRSTASSTASTR